MPVRCLQSPVLAGSAALAALGALVLYLAKPSGYGKYSEGAMPASARLPARAAWFLQELPSFAVPAGILARQPRALFGPPATVLLGLFCAHYFHRTFVYSFCTRGRPFPVMFLIRGFVFCMGNGLLQGYYLIYCAEYPADWYTDIRFSLGVFLFILGMGINIHSDYILRQLRKPGEVIYKIPQGGVDVRVRRLKVACSLMFLEPISLVRSLNGSAMPWPRGPSQRLHLPFSHSVSLGCELFTTIGSTSRCLRTTPNLGKPSFHSSFRETE